MPEFKTILRWAEVFAWMGLIYILSGDYFSYSRTLIALEFWAEFFRIPVTHETLLHVNYLVRKTAHFVEFFVLGMLLTRALCGGAVKFRPQSAALVILLGVIYAMTDEYHQVFIDSRLASSRDVLLDVSGLASSQVWLALRLWREKLRSPAE
jgi:VanZ family protein